MVTRRVKVGCLGRRFQAEEMKQKGGRSEARLGEGPLRDREIERRPEGLMGVKPQRISQHQRKDSDKLTCTSEENFGG